jgi:hypothetical protein
VQVEENSEPVVIATPVVNQSNDDGVQLVASPAATAAGSLHVVTAAGSSPVVIGPVVIGSVMVGPVVIGSVDATQQFLVIQYIA